MPASSLFQVFRGNVIHSVAFGKLEVLVDCLLGVNGKGTIEFIASGEEEIKNEMSKRNLESKDVLHLGVKKILVPGLIDTHIHAPQYAFAGTGTDLKLLDWLETYTFPYEAKFSDRNFAEQVYRRVVRRTLSLGTTTAAYFGSLHLEASKILADILNECGQRSFVGKVCMDRNAPKYYVEASARDSIDSTLEFVEYVKKLQETNSFDEPLVKPIITPRFAPSCSPELMQGLGKLAKEQSLLIQSHISENKAEVEWVKDLFCKQSGSPNNYTEVYDQFHLLQPNTIMAHGIYLSDEELQLFQRTGAAISHCPVSNFSLKSGILDIRRVLSYGISVGLGTDVSGGYSASMWEVMRQAIIASTCYHLNDTKYQPLSYKEAFHLATVGGSEVIGMADKLGNFQVGKYFDAVVLDAEATDSAVDVFDIDTLDGIFQKLFYLGDDRNVSEVYVAGRKVFPFDRS